MSDEKKPLKLFSVTGSIFGDASINERLKNRKGVNTNARLERERVTAGIPPWPISDSSISKYMRGAHEKPADEYLLERIKAARAQGQRLKVVDVGAGNANQWKAFFEKYNLTNGIDVDVFLTTLNRSAVNRDAKLHFRNRIRTTTAANLANRFSDHLGSFDLVFSRIGNYGHVLNFVENAHALLKPGGEVLSTGRLSDSHYIQLRPHFEVKFRDQAAMHLVKR